MRERCWPKWANSLIHDACVGFEEALATWTTESGPSSEAARIAAREALQDTIACIIAGSVEQCTQKISLVAQHAGQGKALAMGSGVRLPAPQAALVTGTAAHALDFDDNFGPAVTHASAVLAPALFALADEEGSSGIDVIDAYVVGLELQGRIGRLVNPSHYEKGWHATSTIGAIGTAGGCARLLKLSIQQTLAAMSNAFSMAAGSKSQFGSMMKPIHAGLAAHNAVLAARMAQAGISGNRVPITGHWGLADLYSEPQEAALRKAQALCGFGETLCIETEGLMPKRFPCCGAAHRTLDGLLELRKRHSLALEQVDRIEVFIPAFARANLRFDDPRDENEARFSLPYCGVRVLQTGRLTLRDLTPERVRDESIRPWLQRFDIQIKAGSVAEELSESATPAITRVLLKDDTMHEVRITMPRGVRRLPFTEEERYEKFSDCCRWAGRAEEAEYLFKTAGAIEGLPQFGQLSRRLDKDLRGT